MENSAGRCASSIPENLHEPPIPRFRAAASTVLSIVYDLPSVSSIDDPAVAKIHEFTDVGKDYGNPGNYLVEFFPWMKHIPSSLAKWKRVAEERSKEYSELFVGMFREVEDRIVPCSTRFVIPPAHVASRDKETSGPALLGL